MSDLEDKSPGAAFEIFLKNESLMEKLKLLDFETQFVQKGLRKGFETRLICYMTERSTDRYRTD